MSRGFTLLELLVVMGIMGLMGTAAVGGYRQMQQGMEDGRVVDNVTKFLTSAYERSQIDHQLVAVYYWNEMLREESQDGLETEAMFGKAIAVRRRGRISMKQEGLLIDEFGDLEQYDADGSYYLDSDYGSKRFLYNLDNPESCSRSYVGTIPLCAGTATVLEGFMSSDPVNEQCSCGSESGENGRLIRFGYKDFGGATWSIGSAYGFEFQQLSLPHGYVFDSGLPSGVGSPGSKAAVVFDPLVNSASANLRIMARRQGSDGSVVSKAVGSAGVEN